MILLTELFANSSNTIDFNKMERVTKNIRPALLEIMLNEIKKDTKITEFNIDLRLKQPEFTPAEIKYINQYVSAVINEIQNQLDGTRPTSAKIQQRISDLNKNIL